MAIEAGTLPIPPHLHNNNNNHPTVLTHLGYQKELKPGQGGVNENSLAMSLASVSLWKMVQVVK
jgi:hypothetical protein